MDRQDWVVALMLGMSVICFVLYVKQSSGRVSPKSVESAKQVVDRGRALAPASVPEMTELLKATASLAEALGKIGPAVTSLVGAILFAAIAALASGALTGSTPTPTPTPISTSDAQSLQRPKPSSPSTSSEPTSPKRATLPRRN